MAERLSVLNGTPRLLAGPQLLHHLVKGQPGSIAIDFTDADARQEVVTYSCLQSRSDALASELLALHEHTQTYATSRPIIPIYMQQCPDLYISQLATLKAGYAFCPLPLDAPEERLRFILRDVEAKIILTTSASRSRLPAIEGIEVIAVDNSTPNHITSQWPTDIDPANAAYIMYTSGSTGTPKGVVISHRAASQALLAHDPHIPAFSRFLQFANPTFDVSVFEIFFPFYRGGTIVSCDRKALLNDLPGIMNALNVDAAELTPSVASSLLHNRSSVPNLKLLLTIGEMLKRSVIEEFGGNDGQPSLLYGMYGPTEATIHCTLRPACAKNMTVGDIGVPLDTVSAFIVKPAKPEAANAPLELVEVGEEGELAVGGYQLADGYLHRDEQTKAAFVDHPKYGRLYRTGDRARLHESGWLECLGRISSGQVKLRGQRIELGEVEYAAAQTAGCKSAVAEVVDGTLVAFCVRSAATLTVFDIQETCKKWMPAFMLPRDVILLNELPYLPSGKIDRPTLIKQYQDLRQSHTNQVNTLSPAQQRLARILDRSLAAHINADTDLPTVGLDSLSAIRIAAQLRQQGFPHADASIVLQAHSIRELDNILEQAKSTAVRHDQASEADNETAAFKQFCAKVLENPSITHLREDIEDIWRCTPIQHAMLTETARTSTTYFNDVSFEIRSSISLNSLKSALILLSTHHPLLRAGFVDVDGANNGHAIIIWKTLHERQIRVGDVSKSGSVSGGLPDFLRPLLFRLREGSHSVCLNLCIHHALYDQWSIDVLKSDLTDLLRGREPPPVPPFQQISELYAKSSAGALLQQCGGFWQQHLQDFTITPIPNLNPWIVPPGLQKLSRNMQLDVTAARSRMKVSGVSLPTVFQAAWSYLMASLSGSSDAIFGVVFSGRHHAVTGIERIVGPLLTTLPFRVDISSVQTCRELLRAVQNANRAMQLHSLTPLVDIKRAAGCAPDTVLFDVLFVWQETSLMLDPNDLLMREVASTDRHEFNLVLELEPLPDRIVARVTYQESHLPQEQVHLLLRQLDRLVERIVQAPETAVAGLQEALDLELLSASNHSPSTCTRVGGVVSAVERQVDLSPQNRALHFATHIVEGRLKTVTLSYQDFNNKVNQFARHLRALGVAQGDLVCICMEKSLDLYVSITATLKAGAGYVPLLPDTPQSRLESILSQTASKMCICDSGTESKIRTVGDVGIVMLDDVDIVGYDTTNLDLPYVGSNVAYVVFTSGSTGSPKGVCVTFDNLDSNLSALAELYPVKEGDRLLQACSQAFDVSVFEIFFSFSTGMCLCSATKLVLFSDLEMSIRAFGITHLSLTPTVAALIRPTLVPTVRFLVTAGEAVTEAVRTQWAGNGLHQGYGPSETTNICSVLMDMSKEHAIGNVGPALRNTSAFVIAPNKTFTLLPAGSVGELAFGGEQVFTGYLNMPDLNAAKLLCHSRFGRIYRSGDIGRILHDGTLLIAGRLDDQVKVRGHRIELGEISAVILRDSGVSDCTTMLMHNEVASDQALVSFYVPQAASGQNTVILENYAGETAHLFGVAEDALPSYMIPRFIIAISAMPHTAQGKLDRRLLQRLLSEIPDNVRHQFSNQQNDATTPDADWSEAEDTAATLLAGTLGLQRQSITKSTSFFTYGLNSLHAIAFAKKVSSHFRRTVGIDAVMRHSSIARLVAHVSGCQNENLQVNGDTSLNVFSEDFAAKIKAQHHATGQNVKRILPCTPLQEAMLSVGTSRSPDAYCNTTTFAVYGDLDRLLDCWHEMVARHDILRTVFVETDSADYPYAQVILEAHNLPIHRSGCGAAISSNGPNITRGAESLRLSHSRPIVLEVVQTDEQSLLTLRMLHAIYDGESMAVLLSEVQASYHGDTLPPPVSAEPFLAAGIRDNQQDALKYWAERVVSYRPQPFPRLDEGSSDFEETKQCEASSTLDMLRNFSKRQATTTLSIFQAAWTCVLSLAQSSGDVCFGNVVSGRSVPVPGVERLVLPCFNTVPMRVRTSQFRTYLELIRSLHGQNLADTRHQLTALRRIQALSDAPEMHLFDSMLLLQPPHNDLNCRVWTQSHEEGSMGMPLVLEILPEADRYVLRLHYLPSRVSSSLAPLLLEAFDKVLSACLAHPLAELVRHEAAHSWGVAGKLATVANCAHNGNSGDTEQLGDDWTAAELDVREVFALISKTPAQRISKKTTMYQLGLDSLNAAQVAAQLRKRGYNAHASNVIENVTPTALAAVVSRRAGTRHANDQAVDLTAFDRRHRSAVINALRTQGSTIQAIRPCTPAQAGMLAQSISSDGALYVNHVAYRIPHTVTMEELKSAWAQVMRRHQILRTGFGTINEASVPFLALTWAVGAVSLPISDMTADDSIKDVEGRVASSICQNIRLPPWRVRVEMMHRTMLLSLHHALYDAEGLRYLLADLQYAMKGDNIGNELSFDRLLTQALRSAEMKQELDTFWRATLHDARIVRFPDLNHVSNTAARIQSVSRTSMLPLPAVERYCKDNNATVQAIGQAAWAILLQAYTGETGVVFGTVLSNRAPTSDQATAFPSLTTLPVVYPTSSSPAELVQSMVAYNARIYRHRPVALDELQRLAGDPGRSLFDTVFVYQKRIASISDFDWPLIRESAAVDYAASLELETLPDDSISLRLTTHGRRVPAAQGNLMLQQYDMLLQRIVTGFHSNVSNQLWSINPAREPCLATNVKLLHEYLDISAQQYPERLALEFVDSLHSTLTQRRRWTYRQLQQRSNQVAHLLRNNGAGTGDIVAVSMTKCPEASFAFVGILKAGCAFLAIDPELPVARQRFILGDSRTAILLVGPNDELPTAPAGESVAPVIRLSETILDEYPGHAVDAADVQADSTCYCLYTSGTTGTPKGVLLSHENAVEAMQAFSRLFAGHWTISSRWLQFASYWFDVQVLEQFWSWSVGITVVGAPRDLVLEDIPGFIDSLSITHIDLTPSLARLVHPHDVPSLHGGVFITGGEALKQEIIDEWGPYFTVCNGYGPTEATIGVTMNTFIGPDAKPSNIGKQFANVGAYVLEPDGDQPVLRGAVGELCVSGKLVGKGYLNRPDLTAKAFPFMERHGERMYRTGDLVRLLSDGSFAFIGRKDTQAKLRGQRLEISEIDNTISGSSHELEDVVSMVVKDEGGRKQTLVSFVTLSSQSRSQALELVTSDIAKSLVRTASETCKRSLPGYMVPTHILPVSGLPLTVNNKIDTKRLGSFFNSLTMEDLQSLYTTNQQTAPMNDRENTICHVIADMLSVNIDVLKRESNFFSVGLSSVSAITFTSLLKRRGLHGATVTRVMQNPTVSSLAKSLVSDNSGDSKERSLVRQARLSIAAFSQRYRNAAAAKACVALNQVEVVSPCTPLQAGLLYESTNAVERPYFNEFRYLLVKADPQRLQAAFNRLASEVQLLRTRFVRTDDGFAQVVIRDVEVPWFSTESQSPNTEDSFAEQRELWLDANNEDILQPVRVCLATSNDAHTLTVYAHHAIYDGISWDLLFEKLAEAYKHGEILDSGPRFTDVLPYGPLCPLPEAKAFWQQRAPMLVLNPLPVVHEWDQQTAASSSLRFEPNGSIDTLRKGLGVSHLSVVQACFEVALQQHFTARTYGHVVSGRSIPFEKADRVIGPLFNTLPTAIGIQAGDSWQDLINRCHQSNVATLPFQHSSLRDIRKWCGRSASDPMFDVLFVFHHRQKASVAPNEELWTEVEQPPRAQYPLAVEISLQSDGSLSIVSVARSNVAQQADLAALIRSFESALSSAAEAPQQRITERFQIAQHAEGAVSAPAPANMTNVNGTFRWSEKAVALRNAIAQTAGADASNIKEHTSIFSLGLDSIDAVKLASRVRKLGLALSVSQILRSQTIAGMMELVEVASPIHATTPTDSRLDTLSQQLQDALPSVVSDTSVARILPATPHQEALIADMLRSEFGNYYNHDVLKLRPGVDLPKLKEAWLEVIKASPILRTAFHPVSSADISATFAQVVQETVPITEVSLSAESEMEDRVRSITAEVRSSFPQVTPTRLTFVKCASERYLVVSLSHAQYDGHSLALLHEDVQQAYSGQLAARPAYDDLIEEALAATNDGARDFWTAALSGVTSTAFPARKSAIATSTVHRVERTSSLTANEIRSFCKGQGVSMQTLAQTCWSLLLAHFTRSLDVVFGGVLACRDSEAAEQVMFPAMNNVPVRAALHGTRLEMLRYMQDVMNDIRPYQRTPLRMIQNVCADGSNERQDGLVDTLFIYQHRPESSEAGPEPLYDSVGGTSSVEYPVAVEMEMVGTKLELRAACKDDALDAAGTRQLLQRLDKVLNSILREPEKPTVDFSEDEVLICDLPGITLTSHLGDDNTNGNVSETKQHSRDGLLSHTALQIREVLGKVAKVPGESVTPSTSIQSIGIDSISAIKVASLLRKQGISLSVSQLIRARTLVKMAELAAAGREPEPTTSRTPASEIISTALRQYDIPSLLKQAQIDQENVEGLLPATPGQVYTLNAWRGTGGQLFYPTFSYHIKAAVDEDQLRKAWEGVVARHAILRTAFCATSDKHIPVLQVVLKSPPASFFTGEHNSSNNTPSPQPMVTLRSAARKHSDGGGEEWRLDLHIHHALYDAVSLPLLTDDFRALISERGRAISQTKYEDFLALSLTPEAQTARQAFWSQYLRNLQPLTLQQPKSRGQQRRVELFKPALLADVNELEQLTRKEDITLQSLLFAAYAKIYAVLAATQITAAPAASQPEDVMLGIYLSNRSHLPDLDRLAAPTLNLVPLRVRAPSVRPVLKLAKQIQEDLGEVGTAQNAAVGLWEIEEWTGVEGVDTFVNFLKLPESRSTEGTDNDGVVITELDGRRSGEGYSRVTEPAGDGEMEMPNELRTLGDGRAYHYSLDLEVAVVNGALDVGLFCAEEMLGLSEAERVVEELKLSLEEMVGTAKA
ncbi:hypothetical protein BAUCODRAFT_95688 [Baudoinia panamericana UAMH 10762]|uniref:Carrier domain-containing protein n=1 Tax=Baudoinia panamericana (strain UAMH 10762) TaxID=717646 RepID=M2LEY6_BAUPA|nr:uncharacterized protein BAUCODRAFT_95688 [Baudoinia panamericana UAMH 10762]EMC92577.1 hypothetical protein BAUCODRAFT_95688 [Baudoinia panamericana UAMH 10762]